MFGKKLKFLRKKVKITQANLAKKLGISPSTVGMYEQGRREPESKMLVKIAEFFNVSVDYLVDSKKRKKYFKNVDEIADEIEFILRNKEYLNNKKSSISDETLNSIVEAVREGIQKAFEDEKWTFYMFKSFPHKF